MKMWRERETETKSQTDTYIHGCTETKLKRIVRREKKGKAREKCK